ncbi:NADH-quinone oxidoreductase subunit NuoE [Rhodomicrobium sp. Az07]|uniref:NADH-quinone oxidoreductase subunit NuoE n=1 Tax=Rhodomicrobium sp. Az07 TaxID=2839034 RepID=UPI001BE6CAC3|nr:NADH-quinone oxidoreductase subunit NuoE [Rhodomicrobium sp. Az07]MBT3070671.1 NADH-quinone oxidoreductase subunit NuoE [Rhodomicrobium sp. Az07]
MSVRRLDPNQPSDFEFTPENLAWAKEQIKKYPEGRHQAAVIPLLWRAQEQHDRWLPEPAIRYVGDLLGMPYIRVYEIATFYSMFNLSPVGRYHVQVCGTTPCMLRGAEDIKKVCKREIGAEREVTPEGVFSWIEVECLGACVNAPMVQINDDYYEDLTPENFEAVLSGLRRGRDVKPGPQTGRQFSAPEGGPTTLLFRDEEKQEPQPERAAEEAQTQAEVQGAVEAASPVQPPEAKSGDVGRVEEERARFERPDGDPDDFTRLADLDPDAQHALNAIGITRYGQVGRLTAEDVEWIETRYPRFKGKTSQWLTAAKALDETNTPGGAAPDAAGRETEPKDKD